MQKNPSLHKSCNMIGGDLWTEGKGNLSEKEGPSAEQNKKKRSWVVKRVVKKDEGG